MTGNSKIFQKEKSDEEKLVDELIAGKVQPSNQYISLVLEEMRGHMSQAKYDLQQLNQARKSIIDLEESVMQAQGKIKATKQLLVSFIEMEDDPAKANEGVLVRASETPKQKE